MPTEQPEALDPPRVKRWRDEIARLREMIDDQKRTRENMRWFLYLGAVLAVPAAFYHPAASIGVMAFAVTTWGTGIYFAWGHLVERGYQLKMAEIELKKELAAAGSPLTAKVVAPVPSDDPPTEST